MQDDIETWIHRKSAVREDSGQISYDTISKAVSRAGEFLLEQQNDQGYWVGELEADVSVSAGYIPLMFYMTGSFDQVRMTKIIDFIRQKQNDDGSWSAFERGPGDISVTVQTYFAIRLSGGTNEESWIARAREFIRAHGGLRRINTITKIWLALFGQIDWQECPAIPPEIMLLPKWFYINLYDFASWSRSTIVALSVLWAMKPTCKVPEFADIRELDIDVERRESDRMEQTGHSGWESFFNLVDRILKQWDKRKITPGRKRALQLAEEWILERQEDDGSWGGIMLPWVYSLFALKSRGYPLDHPAIQKGLAGLEGFVAEDHTSFRLQPATSPVWDTAWAVSALAASGLQADHPALLRAGNWLLDREIRTDGDWKHMAPRLEPGCWSFEFFNNQYPDMDDSAVVPKALGTVRLSPEGESKKKEAISRAAAWVAAMQSDNGGWAAFDKNNYKGALNHVPFADFMTPLDPTCADVSAHAIEFLVEVPGYQRSIERGVEYLKNTQESDGAWYGRWGVNYLYGTALTLSALRDAGVDPGEECMRRAEGWLIEHQRPDGGWGESCHSYDDPSFRGEGESTASQTAWALIGLLATAAEGSHQFEEGVAFLLRTQTETGTWNEELYTGTGFPRAFYLHYDMYRSYFPLLALALYLKRLASLTQQGDSQ